MGRRKSPKNAIINYSGNVLKCWAVFYPASIAYSIYFDKPFDLVWPGLFGIAAPALTGFKMPALVAAPDVSLGFVTTDHIANRTRRKRGGAFQSLTRWSIGGYSTEPPPDYQTKQIRYNEPPRGQYYWRVRLKSRKEFYVLLEDKFREFVDCVSRRQRAGFSHVFSRNDLTPQPFSYREYEASIGVLTRCGLILNRVGGASGQLFMDDLRLTSFIVEYCRHYYSPTHQA